MNKIKLQPLNEFEKHEAETNLDILYSFLHRHHYSIEEYYSIAVFGYLKGIQTYNRREDLQEKYCLPVICWQYIRAEISNHFKSENRQKRKPEESILSLDADYMETESLYNCIGGKSLETEYLETESIIQMFEKFTGAQQKIARMKMEGYSNKEIYLILEIKPSTFYRELDKIKSVLEKMVV